MVQYWRTANYTYLKYANVCARILRNCLKPEYKQKAIERDTVQFNMSEWKNGRAQRPTIIKEESGN